jgi:hypothetical protein
VPPQFATLGIYVFEPTPPLTAALYTLAFGTFATRTAQTSRGIEMGFRMPVNSDLLEYHAEWLKNEVRIVDFPEEWTDFPLPLKNLDIVKNSGLIIVGEGHAQAHTWPPTQPFAARDVPPLARRSGRVCRMGALFLARIFRAFLP